MDCPANVDKNNGVTIIVKSNQAAEHLCISNVQTAWLCYRRYKNRMLPSHNQGIPLFPDGDMPDSIATYNFWRQHKLIVVDPDQTIHLKLDAINREPFLALKYV